MTFFDTINYFLFKNRNTELDNELLENFTPQIVCRYLSFYDKGILTDYANQSLNTYSNIFKSKEDLFRFYENVIPKLRWEKINYVSKKSKEVSKKEEISVPIPEFYSKKELQKLGYYDD